MVDVKEIVDNIFDKYGPNIPGYESGRFSAIAKIAYDHWRDMNRTNDRLIAKYGKGAATGTDDYYHPLMQCQIAKLGDIERFMGLWQGHLKEFPVDYINKRWIKEKPEEEVVNDAGKDLTNNLYGSIMGDMNRNIPCYKLLGPLRPENMKNEEIW